MCQDRRRGDWDPRCPGHAGRVVWSSGGDRSAGPDPLGGWVRGSWSTLATSATQCRCLRLPKVPYGESRREAGGGGPGGEKPEAQEASLRS